MPDLTRDEAIAFIDAMRLTLTGKTGFKWMVEKLGALSALIESLAAENGRMSAYIGHAGATAEYEAFAAGRADEA